MRIYWQLIKRILSRRRCVLVAGGAAFFIFILAICLQNYKAWWLTLVLPGLEWIEKIKLLFLFLTAFSGYHFSTQLLLISLSLLSGLNIALFTYYIKNKRDLLKLGGLSGLGLLIGILGIGCGPCGMVLLSAVIGLSASTGLIVLLPWHGAELGWLGLLLLASSIYLLLRRLAKGETCSLRK